MLFSVEEWMIFLGFCETKEIDTLDQLAGIVANPSPCLTRVNIKEFCTLSIIPGENTPPRLSYDSNIEAYFESADLVSSHNPGLAYRVKINDIFFCNEIADLIDINNPRREVTLQRRPSLIIGMDTILSIDGFYSLSKSDDDSDPKGGLMTLIMNNGLLPFPIYQPKPAYIPNNYR